MPKASKTSKTSTVVLEKLAKFRSELRVMKDQVKENKHYLKQKFEECSKVLATMQNDNAARERALARKARRFSTARGEPAGAGASANSPGGQEDEEIE
eukprot:CAMPEP_0198212422 /NCGR_PEP_ID=MMETSP1445-20131203/25981_1 /TAXON_ID=36898 /ORGANISM="Pyramimonas sp., Strain CCMP2087" /LENGTH=97 /DNA_ID=CAMNT_0043886855 /DNA_START=225 /DNA_END=515 /DNA_ORIENTATION=-